MLPYAPSAPRTDSRFDSETALDLGRIEARKTSSPASKIEDVIARHPHKAVSVIRNWLHQDE